MNKDTAFVVGLASVINTPLGNSLNISTQPLYGAIQLATIKHAGQVRKYTGEPYVVHLLRVAQICAWAGLSIETQIAAILHDIFEDTDCTEQEIRDSVASPFVAEILKTVHYLTDEKVTPGRNRKTRKAADAARLAGANEAAQSIKCADIADNLCSIANHDEDFARVVLPEAYALLRGLTRANPKVYDLAYNVYLAAEGKLNVGQ